MNKDFIYLISTLTLLTSLFVDNRIYAQEDKSQSINSKKPTVITADSLKLDQKTRDFLYEGNVIVKQGNMILTSDQLDGSYDENNEIQELIAISNVHITKGPKIKAKGERAVYNKDDETMTLTENPEVDQDGSIVAADKIIIYLLEDRSVAQGEVRVQLTKADETKDTAKTKSKSKGKTKSKVKNK